MAEDSKPLGDLERKGLTAEILRAMLRYDPETGDFVRIGCPGRAIRKHLNRRAAQYVTTTGYAAISIGGQWRFRAHQLAWLYMTGRWPVADIDHINGCRTDNRWANLRAATRSQNLANSSLRKDNASGIRGVTFDSHRGMWKAFLVVGGVSVLNQRFGTKEAAIAARRAAEAAYCGQFVRAA